MYRLYGTKEVKKIKQKIGFVHKNLYSLSGFDLKHLEMDLSYPLEKMNIEMLVQLENPFVTPTKATNNIHKFRNNFTFCPICLKRKYHSTLHQFHFFQECPFHNIQLVKKCPSCNMEIPYKFDDSMFQRPYQCKCGHLFSENKPFRNYVFTNKISNKGINDWLKLSKENIGRLSNIKLIHDFDEIPYSESDYKYSYTDLNQVLNKNYWIKLNLPKSSQRKLLNNRKKYLIKYHYELFSSIFPNDFNDDYLEKIYTNIQQIFSSIARHYRKTILRNHIKCIKNITRNDKLIIEENCPFAMAYVYWKKRYQGFKDMKFVDNGGLSPLFKSSLMDTGIPINHFYDSIKNLYKNYRYEKYLTDGFINYFTWHINRIIGEIIIGDFKTHLQAAKNHINKGTKLSHKVLNSYKFMPKIIFKNYSKEDHDYFIYIKPDNETDINEMIRDCNCPGVINYQKFINPILSLS
jgi:hypothetical protein